MYITPSKPIFSQQRWRVYCKRRRRVSNLHNGNIGGRSVEKQSMSRSLMPKGYTRRKLSFTGKVLQCRSRQWKTGRPVLEHWFAFLHPSLFFPSLSCGVWSAGLRQGYCANRGAAPPCWQTDWVSEMRPTPQSSSTSPQEFITTRTLSRPWPFKTPPHCKKQ